MKKEELLKQTGILEEKVKHIKQLEDLRKLDFARAFGWYTNPRYGGDIEVRLPTWGEILIEVGKLLTSRKLVLTDDKIADLENRIYGLEVLSNNLSKKE